jgi:hypothetical protein
MLARALPDVLGGDPHPVVALGLGDHRLEQSAVGLLDLAAPTQLHLGVAQPDRERVADAFELRHAEHSRTTHSGYSPLDPGAREGRGEQLAQSLLEQRYLAAKLMAGQPIGGGIGESLDGGGLGCPDRLIQ